MFKGKKETVLSYKKSLEASITNYYFKQVPHILNGPQV